MSLSTLTYLYCDGSSEDCEQKDERTRNGRHPYSADIGPEDTGATQRAWAKKDGWKNLGALDYCATCWKEKSHGH